MAVSDQPTYIPYAGDGISTGFPFPYYFRSVADLVVTVTDALGNVTTLVLTTDYTVAGTLDPDLNVYASGGQVNTVNPVASGSTVLINRRSARTQAAVYNPEDSFPAKSHEAALDATALQHQELAQHYLGYTDGIPSKGIYQVDDWFHVRNAQVLGFKELICVVGGGPGVFVFKPCNPIAL